MSSKRRLAPWAALIACACAKDPAPVAAPSTPKAVDVTSREPAEELHAEPTSDVDRRTPIDPALDGVTYLVDDFETRWPRRAVLAFAGQAYWEESTQRADAGASTDPKRSAIGHREELVVVERRPERLRIVVEASGVRAVVYVDRADFRTVTSRATVLHPRPTTRFRNDVGVHVAPGVGLDFGDRTRTHREVKHQDHELSLRGWVREADLGLLFEPEPFSEKLVDGKLRAATPVLHAPGGSEIARLTPSQGDIEVRVLEEAAGDALKIAVTRESFRVVGYVASANVERFAPTEPLLSTHGTGGGGWGTSGRTYLLTTGDPLFASAGGEQIGVVLHERTPVTDNGAPVDGRRPIGFPLDPWFFVQAWVPEERVQAAIERTAARKRRIQLTSMKAATPRLAEQARRLLEARNENFNQCFDKALKKQPTAHGKLSLRAKVLATKRLEPTLRGRAPAGMSTLAGCVINRLKRRRAHFARGGDWFEFVLEFKR